MLEDIFVDDGPLLTGAGRGLQNRAGRRFRILEQKSVDRKLNRCGQDVAGGLLARRTAAKDNRRSLDAGLLHVRRRRWQLRRQAAAANGPARQEQGAQSHFRQWSTRMALLELERFEFEFSTQGIFRILDEDLDTVSRSQAKRRIGLTHLRAFLEYLLLIYWFWNAQVDSFLCDLDHLVVPLEVELLAAMLAGMRYRPGLCSV